MNEPAFGFPLYTKPVPSMLVRKSVVFLVVPNEQKQPSQKTRQLTSAFCGLKDTNLVNRKLLRRFPVVKPRLRLNMNPNIVSWGPWMVIFRVRQCWG